LQGRRESEKIFPTFGSMIRIWDRPCTNHIQS